MFDPQADDQQLLARVTDYYHHTLKDNVQALDYLRVNGITNAEAIDHFRIGFADRSLGTKLPHKRLKAGKEIRARLESLGILRKSGHEHYRGCLTFPIHAPDGSGQIVDIYGRKIGGKRLRKGTPLDMHLSQQGVWNIEAFPASNEIVLCDSLIDALTFWNHGYRNVSCFFNDDHLEAFAEFKIERVMVTNEDLAPVLLEAGLDCFLLRVPNGMSVNAFACQVDDPPHYLGNLIRMAEWLGKGQRAVEPNEPDEPMSVEPTEHEPLGPTDHEPMSVEPIGPTDNEPTDHEPSAPTNGEPMATPIPPCPTEPEAEVTGDEVALNIGHRRYRVRGLSKNLSFDALKVNLMVSTERGLFVDTFDLYSAKYRRAFIAQAAIELGLEEDTIKKDLGRVLLKLEELQDQQIQEALEPKDTDPMSEAERKEALDLLRDPALMDRIVSDFDLAGEETNKLVGYLAAVSRKLDQPLAIIIQSSSAAGKTSLMDAVLSFVPPEDVVKFSAMTGQSLYYMGQSSLKHRILAIAEEQGAKRANYALKLLQSEGELMIASTGKEPSTGRLITQEYKVEGPVMVFLSTTSISIDEELLNRCIVLTVDEDREQTRAIHELQRKRETLEGLLARQNRESVLALHHNAQRLLKPMLVANPYAESLTFIDDKPRTRRDHVKYLTLIRTITLLHQHQRPVRTIVRNGEEMPYLEVTPDDIELANRLTKEVLGRSDDLPPQTRKLLAIINGMVAESGVDPAEYRFRRRDLREYSGWGDTQLKVHLRRLVELEYVLVHRLGRQFHYELLVDEEPPRGMPLVEVRRIRSGSNGIRSPHGRGTVGPRSGCQKWRNLKEENKKR